MRVLGFPEFGSQFQRTAVFIQFLRWKSRVALGLPNLWRNQEVKRVKNLLCFSVPKGFRLTLKHLKDGTLVVTLEPI